MKASGSRHGEAIPPVRFEDLALVAQSPLGQVELSISRVGPGPTPQPIPQGLLDGATRQMPFVVYV